MGVLTTSDDVACGAVAMWPNDGPGENGLEDDDDADDDDADDDDDDDDGRVSACDERCEAARDGRRDNADAGCVRAPLEDDGDGG